jgi:hypothetical protein
MLLERKLAAISLADVGVLGGVGVVLNLARHNQQGPPDADTDM